MLSEYLSLNFDVNIFNKLRYTIFIKWVFEAVFVHRALYSVAHYLGFLLEFYAVYLITGNVLTFVSISGIFKEFCFANYGVFTKATLLLHTFNNSQEPIVPGNTGL